MQIAFAALAAVTTSTRRGPLTPLRVLRVGDPVAQRLQYNEQATGNVDDVGEYFVCTCAPYLYERVVRPVPVVLNLFSSSLCCRHF